ncbi:caldesmon isoform X4 [Excalfactoria chinensis]|uniref:caldesmon isoform X4 n=1 Tax=Excalfactoria chinensis TaxID=46218 RepID=UPI003B3B7E06
MDDFERRRELRRQKREEMRLEAERLSYQRNDDDDEEAARERRRRARQERLRQKEEGDASGEVTEKSEVNAQNSVAEEETKRSTDDEAALLERLARREERRQKRLQEALERQKEFDPTITDGSLSVPSRREVNNVEENETTGKEEKVETRQGRYEVEETETVTKSYQRNNWRQDGEEEGKKEEKDVEEEKPKEVPTEENQVDVAAEKSTDKEEVVETKALSVNAENDTNAVLEGEQSITDAADKEKEEAEKEREKLEAEEKERLKAEEEKKAAEEKQKAEEEKRAAEERERAKAEEEKRAAEERERAKAEEERKAAEERAKAEEERKAAEARERAKAEEEKRAAEEKARLEAEKLKEKKKMEEKKAQEEKAQADLLRKQVKDNKDKEKAPKEEMKSVWDRKKGVPEQKAQNGERELTAPKLKSTENAFGRSNLKGAANAEADSEKLKEKQQEAAVELDELKKRREERRKILEEEEQKKKQEEAERKIREEEEKKRMKEEIERRRAEAAEKRQKLPEDGVSEEKKPFKCFSPKGSSFKIEERAEFLNKSAQKSGAKPAHTTGAVSKIDSRLEQYTSAVVGNKAAKPAKPAASDLPVAAEGVRNIKSMWEKGNVFSSPGGAGTPNKETAGLKVGVSSRINEWLTKTPEGNKSPAPKPSDLRPGDVSGKRNLWEKQSVEKPAASSSKVTATGKKSETNAGLRQFEKEP